MKDIKVNKICPSFHLFHYQPGFNLSLNPGF